MRVRLDCPFSDAVRSLPLFRFLSPSFDRGLAAWLLRASGVRKLASGRPGGEEGGGGGERDRVFVFVFVVVEIPIFLPLD